MNAQRRVETSRSEGKGAETSPAESFTLFNNANVSRINPVLDSELVSVPGVQSVAGYVIPFGNPNVAPDNPVLFGLRLLRNAQRERCC